MKLTYDPRGNIAYLNLQEKDADVETIRVSDELNVDLAPTAPSTASNCSMPTSSCSRATTAYSS